MRLHYGENRSQFTPAKVTIDSRKISTAESIKATEEAEQKPKCRGRMYVLYTRYCSSFRTLKASDPAQL